MFLTISNVPTNRLLSHFCSIQTGFAPETSSRYISITPAAPMDNEATGSSATTTGRSSLPAEISKMLASYLPPS